MAEASAALLRPRGRAPPPEGEARSWLAAAAGGADGQRTPSAPGFLERGLPPAFSRDEIDRACLGAPARQARPAGDASPAQGPDRIAPGAGHHQGAGHGGDGAQAPEEFEVHRSDASLPAIWSDSSSRSQSVAWEWESSDGDWVSYRARESRQIEKKWQNGASRVRVRSGPTGQTPVEIFFVDMCQLDPETGKQTRIRREGEVLSWRTRARRLSKAIAYSLQTGEPLWESMDQYKERQASLPRAGTKRFVRQRTGDTEFSIETPTLHRRYLHWIFQGHSFSIFAASMVITLCSCVFVGIDVQRYPDGRGIYQKDVPFIATEFCFTGYFLVELVIRFVACGSAWEFSRDRWNHLDAVCVVGSLVDIVFVPVASIVTRGSGAKGTANEFAVLRTLRLFKLLRFLRISRASSELNLFFKGLWSGLKESSMIWAILTCMVFVFSILLTTYATDDMRENNFSSLCLCMNRLVVSGILLDNVADMFDDMLSFSDVGSYIIFIIFVVTSQYIILNMLIGIICSVATDVRGEEKARSKARDLRRNLESIVDCYIDENGKITRDAFQLITKNLDVYDVLQQNGASMEHLASVEESLCAVADCTDFESMFEAIVADSDEGKYATAKDIFNAQNELKKSLLSIESLLASSHDPQCAQCNGQP